MTVKSGSSTRGSGSKLPAVPKVACEICGQDVTQAAYIECAECTRTDNGDRLILCAKCFADGDVPKDNEDMWNHAADHDYYVHESPHRPLFLGSSWGAREEQLLIEGLLRCGFGNWTAVAESVGSRTATECEDHYLSVYIYGPGAVIPLGRSARRLSNVLTASRLNAERAVADHSHDSVFATRPRLIGSKAPADAGYMHKRKDFEVEPGNAAESFINDTVVRVLRRPDDDCEEEKPVPKGTKKNNSKKQALSKINTTGTLPKLVANLLNDMATMDNDALEDLDPETIAKLDDAVSLAALEAYNRVRVMRQRRTTFTIRHALVDNSGKKARHVLKKHGMLPPTLGPDGLPEQADESKEESDQSVDDDDEMGITDDGVRNILKPVRRLMDGDRYRSLARGMSRERQLLRDLDRLSTKSLKKGGAKGRKKGGDVTDANDPSSAAALAAAAAAVAALNSSSGGAVPSSSTTANGATATMSNDPADAHLGMILQSYNGTDLESLLSTKEQHLCSKLHLPPPQYLQVKAAFIKESSKRGQLRMTRAQNLARTLDRPRIRSLYEFFASVGWICPTGTKRKILA
eukprot:Clim_evm6s212 gene=Clim_evmTU6s212